MRPALIVSADIFNSGPSGLVIVCALTRTEKGVRFQVTVDPPEGGVRSRSFVQCDQVRAIAVERLGTRLGVVSSPTLAAVGRRLRILLDV